MAKRFDPSLLSAPPLARETKTFTHPDNPEAVWTFTMRFQAGCATEFFLREQTEKLIERYGPEGAPVLTPGGGTVPVSSALAWSIALLMLGEEPNYQQDGFESIAEAGGEIAASEVSWDFPRWAILAQFAPGVFLEIVDFARDVMAQANGTKLPNA